MTHMQLERGRPATTPAPCSTNGSIRLRVLSLGAGVQSTTLALMAAHGEIGPCPDVAIFADTRWEPPRVYQHLQWLASPNALPFPIHVVSAGDIRKNILLGARGHHWISIPAFSKVVKPAGTEILQYHEDADGEPVAAGYRTLTRDEVDIGIISRRCTTDYKVVPIRRHARLLAGLTGKRSPSFPVVEQWIGISTDEAIRVKPSFEAWQVHRWPLIEMRMSRADCIAWLERHDYPVPPKSACIGCPYHSNERWRQLREEDPDAWNDSVVVDRRMRQGRYQDMRGKLYLHRSCVPLDKADLHGQAGPGQGDLFGNDCTGMCGV